MTVAHSNMLPAGLLQAVSSIGAGKVSFVVGAGCSAEPPTNLPLSRDCSLEVLRMLVADGVISGGECADPSDLSSVTDAVFNKTSSQRDVVERLRQRYNIKLASSDEGYDATAAMLAENSIESVITLNFDLAMSSALSGLGAGRTVGVVECPEQLRHQSRSNVYYLHRNANEMDP